MKDETILLIEKKRYAGNVDIYHVTTKNSTINFLKEDDAFDLARTILKGAKAMEMTPKKKGGRGGYRGPNPPKEVSLKKKKFLLTVCAKGPNTVRDVYNKALKHEDKDIRTVPIGTWSTIMFTCARNKKVGLSQRIGREGVYKTLPGVVA